MNSYAPPSLDYETNTNTNPPIDPYNVPSPRLDHPDGVPRPIHIPYDMYIHDTTWKWEERTHLIRPNHWVLKQATGPHPFITKRVYTLPSSGIELWWESRPYRKQVEMYMNYDTSFDPSYGQTLKQHRLSARSRWYHRLFRIHLNHISWWAVLWWNVGSHALVYAGICLFVPFFNKDETIYSANNGWSSIFLGATAWWIASFLETIQLLRLSKWPHGRWYLYPRHFSPQMKYIMCCFQDKYLIQQQHAEQQKQTYSTTQQPEQYPDSRRTSLSTSAHHTPTLPHDSSSKGIVSMEDMPHPSIWSLLDTWIVISRFLGCSIWLIQSIAFSGSFHNLSESMMDGLVFFPLICGGILFMISGYLGICEVTHSWKPWKQGPKPWTLRSTHWWIGFVYFLGSLSFVLYGILLCHYSNILEQDRAPAYALLIGAILFTASDWGQLLEQGDQVSSKVWNDKQIQDQQLEHAPPPPVAPPVAPPIYQPTVEP